MIRQASWTAEGRRAGRKGRNPLHGANAPSVPWQLPGRLKQGLGSACCVEVSPGGNNSGENSPREIDLRNNAQRRYPKMRPLWSKFLRFRKVLRQLTAAALGLLLA